MKKNIIKATFLTLLLSAVFGSAVSKNTIINENTIINDDLNNNYLPSSHVNKAFPLNYTSIGGIVIIPGPGCYQASCVPIYNNCIADGLLLWECVQRKRDCRSICLGGWIL